MVALDEANDRMMAQLQESTTTLTNLERRLGDAMGSADSNFAATTSNLTASIQQMHEDAAQQRQQHEEQMQ